MSLSTAAVTGASLHMKPTSAGNLRVSFPLAVQLTLFHRRVCKCQRSSSKQAGHIKKIFLGTQQNSFLEKMLCFL
jgi:hypothetical protein